LSISYSPSKLSYPNDSTTSSSNIDNVLVDIRVVFTNIKYRYAEVIYYVGRYNESDWENWIREKCFEMRGLILITMRVGMLV